MVDKKTWVSPIVEELSVEQTLGGPPNALFERVQRGPGVFGPPGQGSLPN